MPYLGNIRRITPLLVIIAPALLKSLGVPFEGEPLPEFILPFKLSFKIRALTASCLTLTQPSGCN